jgi:asparagine synthase (glutamine-hydrolysing)
MCGIAGALLFDGGIELSDSICREYVAPLRHRGPDAEQQFSLQIGGNARLWLGHRRLSIIDLSASANQPMESSSGNSIIVFNGEIYNYKALRQQLASSGCTFQTQSDTEVILLAYEKWGLDQMLGKLDGMFAFALFDKRERALFLVRDRFGKKPLYYSIGNPHCCFFSSDIRSFSAIKNLQRTINPHALGYFFSELTTPRLDSIWNEIKKVPPASYLRFGKAGMQSAQTYWKLEYTADCSLSHRDIVSKSEFLLGNAVKKRLVADVPVSALLSGGIDSSLVVAKMSEHTNAKTYSVGFKDDVYNELPFARTVAQKFGTNHTELIVEEASFDSVNDLILEYGEPFADSSMVPTHLMCREISKTEKVVLGGDGGDEFFGGYASYYFAHKMDQVKHLAAFYPAAKLLHKTYGSYRTNYLKELLRQARLPKHLLLNRNLGFSYDQLREILNDESFSDAADREHQRIWHEFAQSGKTAIQLMSASIQTRLLNDYLVKVDRASMFASLEMRSPFLDTELVEFAATLKPEQLFYKSEPKGILKSIAAKFFPVTFTHREKMGFSAPIGKWFRGNFAKNLQEVVLGGKQRIVDFNYGQFQSLLKEHMSGVADHGHKLWAMYVFHIWANKQ